MKKVFVQVADKNYLEHAKALFINAVKDGKWDGSFCLIVNDVEDSELQDFKDYGVEIIHRKSDNPYYAKFFLFDYCMKKWDYVVYMDCDFIIFKDLNGIVNYEKSGMFAYREAFHVRDYLCQVHPNCTQWTKKSRLVDLEVLREKYDVDADGYNTGFLSFRTDLIQEDTFEKVTALKRALQGVNNHTAHEGTDQPIICLYFADVLTSVDEGKVCLWKCLNESTVATHFYRWDAPWLPGSKYNKKYKGNLKAFNEIEKTN